MTTRPKARRSNKYVVASARLSDRPSGRTSKVGLEALVPESVMDIWEQFTDNKAAPIPGRRYLTLRLVADGSKQPMRQIELLRTRRRVRFSTTFFFFLVVEGASSPLREVRFWGRKVPPAEYSMRLAWFGEDRGAPSLYVRFENGARLTFLREIHRAELSVTIS